MPPPFFMPAISLFVLVAAAATATAFVMLVLVAAAIVVAAVTRTALLDYCGKHVKLVLIGGNALLHVAVYNYLHDVHVMDAISLLILVMLALFTKVHKHRVLLPLVFKVVDNVQLKIVAVVIGKGHKISFHFFHRKLPLSK